MARTFYPLGLRGEVFRSEERIIRSGGRPYNLYILKSSQSPRWVSLEYAPHLYTRLSKLLLGYPF